MLKIALTGSLSSGKTYALYYFKQQKIPAFSFDQEIAKLIKEDRDVFLAIATRFPKAVMEGKIDKKKLVDIVFNDQKPLRALENILYPKAFKLHDQFLRDNLKKSVPMVVVEIPLLFEKKLESLYDKIILATCSKHLQIKWAMQRDGMTAARFGAITRNQLSDAKKRELADYVIFSGTGGVNVKRQVINLIKVLSNA